MNKVYNNKYQLKATAISKKNYYSNTMTLNPSKVLLVWDKLSNDRIAERILVVPKITHNNLVKVLTERKLLNG